MEHYKKINNCKKIFDQYPKHSQRQIIDNKPKPLKILKKICDELNIIPEHDIFRLENNIFLSKQDKIWKEICKKLNWHCFYIKKIY